jgi:two-component system, sensor histidine kinase
MNTHQGHPLFNDDVQDLETAKRQLVKLRKINTVLMQRVERSMEQQANAYSLFQTAIGLEGQVRVRTDELKNALTRLEGINNELVAARDSSERANRFKTRFFTAVGHDLLQPLHAARLSLSGLTEDETPAAERTIAHQIDNALSTVEELLRTILDISRLEAGVIKPDLRPVALADLFDSLISSLSPLAVSKNLFLTARPTDAAVFSDPVMLRRILQNLLTPSTIPRTAASNSRPAGAATTSASRSGTPAPASLQASSAGSLKSFSAARRRKPHGAAASAWASPLPSAWPKP